MFGPDDARRAHEQMMRQRRMAQNELPADDPWWLELIGPAIILAVVLLVGWWVWSAVASNDAERERAREAFCRAQDMDYIHNPLGKYCVDRRGKMLEFDSFLRAETVTPEK